MLSTINLNLSVIIIKESYISGKTKTAIKCQECFYVKGTLRRTPTLNLGLIIPNSIDIVNNKQFQIEYWSISLVQV
jgi:hypothetical protein